MNLSQLSLLASLKEQATNILHFKSQDADEADVLSFKTTCDMFSVKPFIFR